MTQTPQENVPSEEAQASLPEQEVAEVEAKAETDSQALDRKLREAGNQLPLERGSWAHSKPKRSRPSGGRRWSSSPAVPAVVRPPPGLVI